jgi:hypothetical protein
MRCAFTHRSGFTYSPRTQFRSFYRFHFLNGRGVSITSVYSVIRDLPDAPTSIICGGFGSSKGRVIVMRRSAVDARQGKMRPIWIAA